jgi:hypothetical protein
LLIVFNAAPGSSAPQSAAPSSSSDSSTTASTTSTAGADTSTTAPGAQATVAPITYSSTRVRTGLLVLSRFTRGGTTDAHAYDSYSILRSLEHIFGQAFLAKARSARAFDTEVF